jgi:hypothetical protein
MYKLLKVANIGDKSQYIIVEYVMEIYWEKLDENVFVSYRISNRSEEFTSDHPKNLEKPSPIFGVSRL